MSAFDCKSIVIVVLTSILAFYVIRDYNKSKRIDLFRIAGNSNINPITANAKLRQHNKVWNDTAEIITVTDGVYVGIGFALANVVILETEQSLIVVDTTESISAATVLRKAFNASTPKSTHKKPISTIIYTHFHPDHTNGGAAFIDDIRHPPKIYAHPLALEQITRIFSIASSVNNIRSMRQFGTLLNEIDEQNKNTDSNNTARGNLFENSGIGPFLKFGDKYEGYITMPTHLLNEEHTQLTIDNLELSIHAAPGETPDQIFIYLPHKRVLLPADNIYESFPNIYAIRGSPTRDARKWTLSLDKMRALSPRPLFLVPHHTRPVYGEQKIADLLRDYRDGISYIHDQTVRHLNKGLYPEQIIPLIHRNMPKRLKDHPYLQEFYGTIDWSVRGIFHSYLGWFSGDAADLYPLSKVQDAKYLLQLVNNDYDTLLSTAQRHIEHHDGERDSCQYGLDIATKLLYYYKTKQADMSGKNGAIDVGVAERAKTLRIAGLNCMASFMVSANGRNYYLTQAVEEEMEEGDLLPSKARVDWAIQRVPVDQMMSMSMVRLKVEEMSEFWRNVRICYDFEQKWYQFLVRDGVGEVKRGYSTELLSKLEEASNGNTIDDVVNKVMVDYAFIVFNVSREECHDSDFVMQIEEQDFRDLISEFKTSSAMLFAQGKINMLKGNPLHMKQWKAVLEMQ